MKTFRETAHCGINIMGEDFYATIDFRFTPGSPATWSRWTGTWDPPEGPDYEVDAITLQRDEPGKLGPAWELDGAMLDSIIELDCIEQAMVDAMMEAAQ